MSQPKAAQVAIRHPRNTAKTSVGRKVIQRQTARFERQDAKTQIREDLVYCESE